MDTDRRQGSRAQRKPSPAWFAEQAKLAGDRLRAMDYSLLGPAGRTLRDMLDKEDAAAAEAALPGNVISLSSHPRFQRADEESR